MAQRDEKLNFTYQLFNGTAEWKVELYLPLFNGTEGMKGWTLRTAAQWQRDEK